MILFKLSQDSVESAVGHIESIKERVLVGIRLGMRDGLRGLAQAEVTAVASHRKSGLLERILSRSGKVIETDQGILATYRPRYSGKQPHYWLESGVNVPAVDARMKMTVGGEAIVRMSHRTFTTRAQQFFFSTAEQYRETFLETLRQRMDEAARA